MQVLKKLFDLSLAVRNCEVMRKNEESEDAMQALKTEHANFEKVVLSQRLDENERCPPHLELQKPSQVSTPHDKEFVG
jgi:hypothetical protein